MLSCGPVYPTRDPRNQLTILSVRMSHGPMLLTVSSLCVCRLPASHPAALSVFAWSPVAPRACVHIAIAYLRMTPKSKKRGVSYSMCRREGVRSSSYKGQHLTGGWLTASEIESPIVMVEAWQCAGRRGAEGGPESLDPQAGRRERASGPRLNI